ncbi:MAG TPA: hypothetical protein VM621_00600, partial [Luteibacter sp.]|uniref:hypothetical protein n=1 Tax=Luteibacter sp. TaxID=1886636 RepID=UPI002CBBE17F
MKDHHPTPGPRNLALRERRRGLLQPSAGDAPDLLPVPIIYGTYNGGLGRDQLLGDFDSVNISVGPWDYADLTDTIYLHWGDQWHQTFPVTSTVGAQ